MRKYNEQFPPMYGDVVLFPRNTKNKEGEDVLVKGWIVSIDENNLLIRRMWEETALIYYKGTTEDVYQISSLEDVKWYKTCHTKAFPLIDEKP